MRHPVLQNRARLIVWWLVWIILGLGQYLLFYAIYGNAYSSTIPDIVISFLLYSGISLVLWYPFRFFNSTYTKTLVLIVNLIVTGALTVAIWIISTKYILDLVLPATIDYRPSWEIAFPYRIGIGVFIYGLVILTYYLFVTFSNLAEKNAREAKLEATVKETELKMLLSQINPHFLFNSLNSVSSLTITDPEKARTMVIKLSEFMRYALARKDEKPVSLKSELDNLRLYLDIEKVRFGERLVTIETVSPECLEVKVPVMLLQPLYENAIKHGVYESTENVTISTVAEIRNNFLEISIVNNFDPGSAPVKGTGTGLQNVSRRLDLFYGKNANLNTRKENGLFTVQIFLPANINC